MLNNHCHQVTTQLQLINIYYYYYYYYYYVCPSVLPSVGMQQFCIYWTDFHGI